MDDAEKINLIKSGLQEVLDVQIMENVLKNEKRPIRIYWGTAPTGKPHCGYFVPMVHIAQFLKAECEVTVLLADVHAQLDNEKAPEELATHRAVYYEFTIKALMRAIDVPIERLKFVHGSSYQFDKAYQKMAIRAQTKTTEHDARKAGAEVVKQSTNAPLSGLVYPIWQALDEIFLKVDAQFGGVDQRKIFTLAKQLLPQLGFKPCCHLMNAMIPGLTGGKMSSSEPNSKIDILDPPDKITKKINKSHTIPRETAGNGLLAFLKYVIFPIGRLRGTTGAIFTVNVHGSPLKEYSDYDALAADYESDAVNPQSLKPAVADALINLLAPVQKEWQANAEWQAVAALAYPDPSLSPEQQEVERKKAEKKAAKAAKAKARAAGHSPAIPGTPDNKEVVDGLAEGVKNTSIV